MFSATDFAIVAKEAEDRREMIKFLDKQKAQLMLKEYENATVNFCDHELSEKLRNIAKGSGWYFIDIMFEPTKDIIGNILLNPVIESKKKYANGDKSFCSNPCITYSLDKMQEYLRANGYEIEMHPSSFMRYGWGAQKALRVRIIPKF